MTIARYDGQADWYDGVNAAAADQNGDEIRRLLGPGRGRCLDLCCGTGQYTEVLRATGRDVIGVDRSADQLRLAGGRAFRTLVQADAAALPFADSAFDAVAALWISTDVDDFAAVVAEAARVLVPGGVFAVHGVHPCFNGPHVELREDDAIVVHTTYQRADWHRRAPYWRQGGFRSRVGMRHVPLAEFLTAFVEAGLAIERVIEARADAPIPNALGIRARLASPGAGDRVERWS